MTLKLQLLCLYKVTKTPHSVVQTRQSSGSSALWLYYARATHTQMKAYRQYESAQCFWERLCVVHLEEFMCGNDSVECVRLKVQDWGHTTVWKHWTSHINLPFAVFFFSSCIAEPTLYGEEIVREEWRPEHNQYLPTTYTVPSDNQDLISILLTKQTNKYNMVL